MEPFSTHSATAIIKQKIQPTWFAIYTKPRHEKKVFQQLQLGNVEAYLPLQTTIKQWSDRKKKVKVPLFSCYLFVRITPKEYYTVVNVAGVIRYVTFEGKAVAIPDKQIQFIKSLLENNIDTSEVLEPIPEGEKVEIVSGPLLGFAGELVEYAGKRRVVVRINEINKILLVNVPANTLKCVG
jgi:transcriptional antiterminator RfaH